jgi:hypothetical protein
MVSWKELKDERMKEKRYNKNKLRERLERNMRERRCEPELTVSPMEFSRWLRYFVAQFKLDERICQTKTLDESIVDAFGIWLGYPLR